jgi:hypothetical protein
MKTRRNGTAMEETKEKNKEEWNRKNSMEGFHIFGVQGKLFFAEGNGKRSRNTFLPWKSSHF